MALRLLLLGREPRWLPPWRQGRLLLGASPTADARLEGPFLPFHCLVELAPGRRDEALVHDLARRGDVRDGAGNPVGIEGLRLRQGERFALGPYALALVLDEDLSTFPPTPGGPPTRACAVCGSASASGRELEDLFVCTGCLGVVDVTAEACPAYELVARLGYGASGSVYLGRHRERGAVVAVKLFCSTDRTPAARIVPRFLREASLLARLSHPNIVRVFDAGSSHEAIFIVSEFVRGGDALARLRAHGPLPPHEVARLGVHVADALLYAHALQVIHRDVKPANVLLDLDGTAKLADFGLAKSSGVTPVSVTGSNVAMGTFAYAAPEQLRDARAVGPAADVFGLGATLYHLATDRVPRESLDLLELARRAFDPIPPAEGVRPSIGHALSLVIDRSLRPQAAERPDLASVRAELARLATGR